MRLKLLLAALTVATIVPAHAITFPVKDAKAAIAIARKVCSSKTLPTAKWNAGLETNGIEWFVSTHLPKRSGWVVSVPVNGPYPTECRPLAIFYGPPRGKAQKPAPPPGMFVPIRKPPPLVRKRDA